MADWTFKGEAKRLDDVDLPRIGRAIGVGEDELHAFMDVEAAGSGFDDSGRPKMLFEPHIFYKLLGPGKTRDKAVAQGLAYAKWKRGGYPADSYDRLKKAMKLNATIALMSASFGLFQIMGFNHGKAGYATPEDMVRDFMADEDNHVEAAIRFLINSKLDDDLRARRWDTIEKGYNGGGFGGAYAKKMAAAFARWQKIKDTPYDPKVHGVWDYLPGREKTPRQIVTDASVSTGPVSGTQEPEIPATQPSAAPSDAGQASGPTPKEVGAVIGGGALAGSAGVPWGWVIAIILVALVGIIVVKALRRQKA